MGTTYTVKVAGAAADTKAGRIRTIVEAELDRVDRAMSTYDADSELSRFNRHDSTQPFVVSQPTLEVFGLAREVSELTEGAFDVTVGPLVAAWGFGATDRIPAPPTKREMDAARRRVGFRLVDVDQARTALVKHRPDVHCDLSAIAKGYAVDRVVDALLANGYPDTMVEVGGDLRATGRRSDGNPWRIAIEQPRPQRGRVQRVINLSNTALATSGDYRNYYEVGGRRVSHLLNPRTGTPATGDLASVSVLHPSAAMADALATALSVIGVDEALALADRRDLAVMLLVRDRDTIREVMTRAFADRLTTRDNSSDSVPGSSTQP